MLVVDYEPNSWLLYRKGEDLYLDVNCSHASAGYGILVLLERDEAEAYASQGRAFLDHLARQVQDAGPGSALQLRDVTALLGEEAMEAFRIWRAAAEAGT